MREGAVGGVGLGLAAQRSHARILHREEGGDGAGLVGDAVFDAGDQDARHRRIGRDGGQAATERG